jgi:ABC-type microcin C transport system permease subunit YejE
MEVRDIIDPVAENVWASNVDGSGSEVLHKHAIGLEESCCAQLIATLIVGTCRGALTEFFGFTVIALLLAWTLVIWGQRR